MIRLIIADDHPLVREGLKRVVERHADLTIIDEVDEGSALVSALEVATPDVLLLDLEMPNAPVGSLVSRLVRRWPALPVLMLSMHPEEVWAIPMLRAGASGYVVKSRAPDELVRAIRTVRAGQRYVSPTVAHLLTEEFVEGGTRPRHSALSRREFEVLCLIARGDMLKTVGRTLGISPRTVSTYRARILEKLKLQSTADLIAYAIRHGLSLTDPTDTSLQDGQPTCLQSGQRIGTQT